MEKEEKEEEEIEQKIRNYMTTGWRIKDTDGQLENYIKTLSTYEWWCLPLNHCGHVYNVLRLLDENPELFPVTEKLYFMLKMINRDYDEGDGAVIILLDRVDLIDVCMDVGYGIHDNTNEKMVLHPTEVVLRKGYLFRGNIKRISRYWEKEYNQNAYVLRNIVTT